MRVLVLCMSCLCLWLGKVSGIIVSSCSWESQCLQLSVLVSADYVVQVELVSYSHPSNTRSDGQCCDSTNNGVSCMGQDRCDTYFIYCLMPRTSTATGCPNIVTDPGFTVVSNLINDGDNIDSLQPRIFNLTGITTAWEVMITVCIVFLFMHHLLYCRELSFTYKCWIMIMDQLMLL